VNVGFLARSQLPVLADVVEKVGVAEVVKS
jgi:hypothetical protein